MSLLSEMIGREPRTNWITASRSVIRTDLVQATPSAPQGTFSTVILKWPSPSPQWSSASRYSHSPGYEIKSFKVIVISHQNVHEIVLLLSCLYIQDRQLPDANY